jgi:hypothetical protein
VRLRFEGAGLNRDALGAVVRVTAGGVRRSFTVGSSSSFLSTSESGIRAGVGAAERVERVEVRWPSGAVQEFRDLPVGRDVRLVEGREGFRVEE